MNTKLLPLVLPCMFALTCNGINLDPNYEDSMKKGYEHFYRQCHEDKKKDDPTFSSLYRIAEKMHEKLEQIQPGQFTKHPLFKKAINHADSIMEQIETFSDYQNALEQAKEFNSGEAWRIVHDIVYRHAREIIQEKSDFVFPSLQKDYIDMHEKLVDFAEANKTIDPEKNGPYLEALSFIIYNVKFMQDHCSDPSTGSG